jgi:formyltetrahydrofolate-dependent phosphoribosylglycinamide formyltransferase
MVPRLAVFISGSGTNLQAVLDAIAGGRLQAEVVLVVSNRQTAFGLIRSQRAGVPRLYFPLKPYRDAGVGREAYDADLAERVSAYQPDLIILAGWMHVLSPAFLSRFPRRVINLHPALPGMFAGTEAIRRAFDAYQRGEITHTGCMVHYAVPEVDAGPVLAQAEVPIRPGDSLNTLEERMHATEHRLIVEAITAALDDFQTTSCRTPGGD